MATDLPIGHQLSSKGRSGSAQESVCPAVSRKGIRHIRDLASAVGERKEQLCYPLTSNRTPTVQLMTGN